MGFTNSSVKGSGGDIDNTNSLTSNKITHKDVSS